ncbi:hypothetical protein MNBD_GAMMA06-3 [hydrothermal vent metagenome]|uniref:Transmembrane protein n=1 Tax=hydrothermal vent metagenome TaxID=652676 RepID=A0A3B0XDJ9_9ZZZZ
MTLEKKSDNISTVKVIYILLIVGTLVGFTGIIALIMAYVMKDGSSDWLQTHYRFQIRTYWISLLYIFIGFITLPIMLGYFILIFTFVWMIVRCTKGLKQLEDNMPVKNLESWFFT